MLLTFSPKKTAVEVVDLIPLLVSQFSPNSDK